jgi:RimJ/RimL family protein N-acetyltransferase
MDPIGASDTALVTATTADPASTAPAVALPRLMWVPIRSLAPRHRERIATHLLALEPGDRYLRFGHPATDAHIQRYVDALDFDRDELFGIFNRRLVLIAMAHLAYAPPASLSSPHPLAEFGVSVLGTSRGRGYGARLFDHAVLHARNRGSDRLFIHALSENAAMLKIATKAGAVVERDGAESEAWLRLPLENITSHVNEAWAQQAAELDYQLKLHLRRVGDWLDAAKDVSDHIIHGGKTK